MATANLSALLRRVTREMAAETLGDRSDRLLVESLLRGRDEAAFEALVRRHGPMVYRVCWRAKRRGACVEQRFRTYQPPYLCPHSRRQGPRLQDRSKRPLEHRLGPGRQGTAQGRIRGAK